MKKKSRVVIIVQARMGSTRLFGKVLMPVLEKSLLLYLMERLGRVKNADAIVIATTDKAQDDCIQAFCQQHQFLVFRGSEEDVLQRYYEAAKWAKADVVVRVTGDCPLIDPAIIEKVIQHFLDNSFDYVGNTLKLTYPRGMDVEVFSMNALERASQKSVKQEEREHVTLHIYRNPEEFRLANVSYSSNYSRYRLTVDTLEDFELVRKIIETLYPVNSHFTLEEIIQLLQQNPTLEKINSHITQKKI